jgi:hypothetical protein
MMPVTCFATPSFAFDEPALLVGSREDGFEDDVVYRTDTIPTA